MKKNEKRARVMNALRLAISHSMSENGFVYERCGDGCDGDCEHCGYYTVNDFMVSFYDNNHKHLVSNWLRNSSSPYPYAISGTINNLAESLDIDIDHLTWQKADDILHKMRYIRIGRRTFIENEDGYIYDRENGLEYDIYSGAKYSIAYPKRYITSWYSDPELDRYYLR